MLIRLNYFLKFFYENFVYIKNHSKHKLQCYEKKMLNNTGFLVNILVCNKCSKKENLI